jgi:hypothetical protein
VDNQGTAELAKTVLEVAVFKPYKRRRLQYLADEKPELMDKLLETGLLHADHR